MIRNKKISLLESFTLCLQNTKNLKKKILNLNQKMVSQLLLKESNLLESKDKKSMELSLKRHLNNLAWNLEALAKNLKNLMKMNLLNKSLISYVQKILCMWMQSELITKRNSKMDTCFSEETKQKNKEIWT